jgi:hypothetical protein
MSDDTNAITVRAPRHVLASHAAYSLDSDGFEAEVLPIDQYGIVKLKIPNLSVSWGAEQWAAVIPALVAQLPAEQQVQVIDAIRGAGVSQ